jgi:hypothetical protein
MHGDAQEMTKLEQWSRWTKDPDQFPSLRALSPAFFFRRVPVYTGAWKPRLEFVAVEVSAADTEENSNVLLAIHNWNLQWEAGPYRAIHPDEDLPEALRFLQQLEHLPGRDTPHTDIVLVPWRKNDVYTRWAHLYHLLPRSTLLRFELPIIPRGLWPASGFYPGSDRVSPGQQAAFERAFAQHLWSCGLGRTHSPLGAFGKNDSLKLLSHDLNYWHPHMEALLREYSCMLDRVDLERGDDLPESYPHPKHTDLRIEMPRRGMEVWTGEAEAREVTRDLIDMADERGKLRSIIDAIRSNRVEEDFSNRWSAEREDFARKLYRKRNKIKVSFVELDDSIPFHDAEAELVDGVLYRSLLSVVDVKDRQVVVCLHKGITGVSEIAQQLGYANHSPISKALQRIRSKAAKLLD